jgi:hypothetical protein
MDITLLETAPPCASSAKGRPAYHTTPEHRNQVKLMAGYCIPQYQIAKVLQISAPTLRKHYREQLDLSSL